MTERSARGEGHQRSSSARRGVGDLSGDPSLTLSPGRGSAGERRRAPGEGRARCTAEQGVAQGRRPQRLPKGDLRRPRCMQFAPAPASPPPDLRHERRRAEAAAGGGRNTLSRLAAAARFRVAPSRCVEANEEPASADFLCLAEGETSARNPSGVKPASATTDVRDCRACGETQNSPLANSVCLTRRDSRGAAGVGRRAPLAPLPRTPTPATLTRPPLPPSHAAHRPRPISTHKPPSPPTRLMASLQPPSSQRHFLSRSEFHSADTVAS